MASLRNLPSLDSLTIVREDDNGVWLSFEKFYSLLREQADNTLQNLRKDNLLRFFKQKNGYADGLISFEDVLHYIFKEKGTSPFYAKVCKEIETFVLKECINYCVISVYKNDKNCFGSVRSDRR